DILREGVLQLVVLHRMAAVLDDDQLAGKTADVGQRLEEDVGFLDRGHRGLMPRRPRRHNLPRVAAGGRAWSGRGRQGGVSRRGPFVVGFGTYGRMHDPPRRTIRWAISRPPGPRARRLRAPAATRRGGGTPPDRRRLRAAATLRRAARGGGRGGPRVRP